jgi:hypothetical protein
VEELLDYIDGDTLESLLKTCSGKFTEKQIETLSDYCIDDELIETVADRSGVRINSEDDVSLDDISDEAPLPPKKHGLLGYSIALGGRQAAEPSLHIPEDVNGGLRTLSTSLKVSLWTLVLWS